MNYKLLPKTEWEKVTPIWAEHGSTPPVNDPYALISVQMDDDKLVGCMAMQSVLHIEGIWNHPAYSGRVGFRSLRKQLLDALPQGSEYYAFAPTWPVVRICEYGHMEKKNWTVYRGRT